MTKAIRFHEFGGPEVLRYEDVEIGDPGEGQVRLRQTAIGFNFLDALVRQGQYPVLPELPSIPGGEAVGVVEAVGSGVDNVRTGQRVAYAAIFPGGYSQARLLLARDAIVLPDSVSDEDAAAGFLKGMTVEYLINRCYPASAGEFALVHAAAGGVGQIMCQWLKHLGVTVIGTTTSQDKKQQIIASGADFAINSREEDLAKVVKEITGGDGVHVVYDSVGPALWQPSIQSLRPRGYYVNFGNASGNLAPIDPGQLHMQGSVFFTKASMRHYQLNRQELEASATALFDMIGKGVVKPVIGQRYDLADAAQAQADAVAGRTTGSTILVP